jgi:N-acetyl-gamma-glutamyl-phosphate reductase
MANVYTPYSGTQEQAEKLYEDFYTNSPFVFLSPQAVDVKQVVNTNKCFLHLQVHEGQILISSVIDNLIKGASGQAVQNMNLMLGWSEDAGLKLKAIGF